MHILKAAPAQNAVTQAKDAILKLAAERADLQKKVEVTSMEGSILRASSRWVILGEQVWVNCRER